MLPRPAIITPWRGVQRPPWPFAVNRDSPQAEGLFAWWPVIDVAFFRDLVGQVPGLADGAFQGGATTVADDLKVLAWSFGGNGDTVSPYPLVGTPAAVPGVSGHLKHHWRPEFFQLLSEIATELMPMPEARQVILSILDRTSEGA
jgi:hypothetical protein